MMRNITFTFFILVNSIVKCQSIYCDDINPDSSISISYGSPISYELDLNSDGIIDYIFSVSTFANSFGGESTARIFSLDSNLVLGDSITYFAFELNVNDSITDSPLFHKDVSILHDFNYRPNTHIGLWQNYGSKKYCSIKFKGDSTWYYGTITLNIESGVSHSKITVYEYCYSTKPFKAGEYSTLSAHEEHNENRYFNLFPNPCNNFIFIKNNKYKVETNYEISNMMGQQFSLGKLNNEITKIDVSFLSRGLYILNTDKFGSQHFVVKK